MGGLLPDVWRDVIAGVGLLLTVIGLAVTSYQAWKARKSADAARQAADEAHAESRRRFETYTAAELKSYASQAKLYIVNGEWQAASLRMGDLADGVQHFEAGDETWKGLGNDLRDAANTCVDLAKGKGRPKYARKWQDLLDEVLKKLSEKRHPV